MTFGFREKRCRKNLPLSAPSMPLPADLERLEELINGINYATMLEVHDVLHAPNATQASLVQQCIPDSDPMGFAAIDADDLIATFSRCVLYPGHLPGHGPDKGTFDSSDFITLFDSVKSSIRAISSDALPHKFSFRFGRPYSPIFWDFAFLFHGAEKSSVLVGASWD